MEIELFESLNRLDRAASLAPLSRGDHIEVQLCTQRLRDALKSMARGDARPTEAGSESRAPAAE